MDLGIMALRLVHIGSAIMWAGGSIFLDRFFQPTADELGPAGEPFVAALMRRGLAVYFPVVAGLTVLAGTALYWIDSGGNMVGWLTGGGPGTVYGIGGIAAWIGFIVGGIGVAPNAGRLARARARSRPTGLRPSSRRRWHLRQRGSTGPDGSASRRSPSRSSAWRSRGTCEASASVATAHCRPS